MDEYKEFIKKKICLSSESGFVVRPEDVNPMLKPHQNDIVRWSILGGRRAIFASFGLGKAQHVEDNILTPTGWSPIGKAMVGDSVIGSDGLPHKITGVFPQGNRDMYEVIFSDKSKVRCDYDHLWEVRTPSQVAADKKGVVKTAREIKNKGLSYEQGQKKNFVPIVKPIEFGREKIDLPLDPYTLGVLIGDGSLTGWTPTISNPDAQVISNIVVPDGCKLNTIAIKDGGCPVYSISGGRFVNSTNPLTSTLKELGLYGKKSELKFIPEIYLFSKPDDRLAILQGLLDTDGYCSGPCIEFSSASMELSIGVAWLVRSLGGTSTEPTDEEAHYVKDGVRMPALNKHRVIIKLPDGVNAFRLERKQNSYNPIQRKNPRKTIVSMTEIGKHEAVCIMVDAPDHLYVTEGFTLTHNTFAQLEIMRLIGAKHGGKQLIVAPLGVRQEFKIDAAKLGIEIKFIRRTQELTGPGIYITNYESVRDGRLDVNEFIAATLDEASVLRSYGSKTFQTFLRLFSKIRYRFVATATPSPNKYKELIHYAGFLGVMDTGDALTRFFKRDSSKAGNLQIHPHKEKEFWFWIHSWAIFIQKPSDLGYSDEGYDLPPLRVHYHKVGSDAPKKIEKSGQVLMFNDASLSLSDAASEKRNSLSHRIDKAVGIISESPDEHYIVWHDQEVERHALKKAFPDIKDVYGSQDLEIREQRVVDFSNGYFKWLATKPSLSGSGCNFQRHCSNSIFLGISFKFNDLIQAIHRIYRFLQTEVCDIHIIYSENETQVLQVLKNKWKRHEEMVEKMSQIIKKYGLSHSEMAQELERAIGVERIEVSGKNFVAANNDCVEETKLMKENSIDLIVTSIPFSNHYEYTPNYNDMGHTDNNDHFWAQMDFLTPNLLKVLSPGRIYACHVKDRILFGNVTGKGAPTVSPFHMEATFHAMKHGFDYMGMITVVTDVVRENNQTYRLGWTEKCKDGTKMGVGSPEYVLLFRAPQTDRSRGYADVPVVKSKDDYTRAQWQIDAHAYWKDSGDRLLDPEEMAAFPVDVRLREFKKWDFGTIYNYEHHVKIGKELDVRGSLPSKFMAIAPTSKHPDVWDDILRMKTLNSNQSKRNQNQHICPLQIGIVERLIERYSNKGEVVFDPFGGIMTVPYVALKMGRKGRASELNPQYFLDGVKYLEAEEREQEMPTLTDFIKKSA